MKKKYDMIHAIPSPPPSPRGGMVSRRDPSNTRKWS